MDSVELRLFLTCGQALFRGEMIPVPLSVSIKYSKSSSASLLVPPKISDVSASYDLGDIIDVVLEISGGSDVDSADMTAV